ncbi:heat shock transcription factor, X-linked member 4 [Alexandromys fortis]|uniref:heat shock transcription factor, X-linked member 4 n=1 Tax=Alexandromys fortis TaxID=100897 RepID=UPI0021520744|nr:heat shock transcription factor, X-linked member 4 [Microtus fortis]
MASQSVEENCGINVSPVVNQEPENEALDRYNSSHDSEADSKEGLVRHDDQDVIQDQAYVEIPLPEDQSQPIASEEDNTNLFSLPFPMKLWSIVQNEAFKSVKWTKEGDTIMIEVDLFQKEVLHLKGAKKIFETDSLKNFIRQLNMHGFRKIYPETSVAFSEEYKRIMMYRHFNFQRDKPGLVEYIWGKEDLKNLAHLALCVPIPLRSSQEPTSKKKKSPTKYSPRFYRKPEEDGEDAKKKSSNDQAHKGNQGFVFSAVWAMKFIPPCSLEMQLPGESSNPIADDTSGTIICGPPTAPGIQGTEENPSASSSDQPILSSMMCLYNSSCSALLSTLLGRPTNESPNEEQEGSSDYKCVICEPIKNSPRL